MSGTTANGGKRNLLIVFSIILLVGMGEELWVRFLPQYLENLGGSVWVVAAYGVLYSLLDGVYQYPGGWIADHLGRRRALTMFTLAAAAGYSMCLLPGWPWVLFATFLVMAWDALTLPALFATVADNLPPARRATGFAVQSIVRRIPTIVAPPLGGLLVAWLGLVEGVRLGLALTVALGLVAAVVVAAGYRDNTVRPSKRVAALDMWRGLDGRLKTLLVSDVLSRWAEGIPRVFVVIFCLGPLAVSPIEFGWLIAIQRTTNVLVYVPLAPLADRMNRKPFVLATFLFFALFPLMLAHANGFAGAVAAFLVAGLWEVGEPARKALIVDLADPALRGRSVGIYYLARNLAVFPAALVGGILWQTIGPRAMLHVAFAVGLVGFVFFAVWGPTERPTVAESGGAS
ncbi:MAG: MFS transporter [Planctomycetota bacterium]